MRRGSWTFNSMDKHLPLAGYGNMIVGRMCGKWELAKIIKHRMTIMSLRIHVLQHVPFEGPALIGDWALDNNHSMTFTRFFAGDHLAEIHSFDMLIVLGGPMGVDDIRQHPWLAEEVRFLQTILERKTPVLGICLGAQLIAKALGARVYRGIHKEIGWFPVHTRQQNFPVELQKHIPAKPVVFHWHGDTFDLPEGSRVLARSTATPNQAFIYDHNVIGLQFHLETTITAVENLLEHAGDEIVEGRYIQTPEQMLTAQQYIEPNKYIIFAILNYLSKLSP